MKKTILTLVAAALATSAVMLATADPAQARIKLATLPAKQNVQVRFDHPSLVLVEEEREIALQGPSDSNRFGLNTIDFSWAGTAIDKQSIVFRPATEDPQVRVLSTSYPPGENALTWQVACDAAKTVRFRVSYLMGAIDRETSYQVVVKNDESSAELRHYFKVMNNSGENFTKTNFVTNSGVRFERDVANGEAKRMSVTRFDGVSLAKEYVFAPWTRGEAVQTDYVLKNAKEQGTGRYPLDAGKVRIYQEDGKGGTAFIGEDWGRFTAIGDEMRLNIGTAQDIKVERKLFEQKTENRRGNVYDSDEVVHYEVKNFKSAPITLKVIERMRDHWEWQADSSAPIAKQESNEEIHFNFTVPPIGPDGKPTIFKFHYKRLHVW